MAVAAPPGQKPQRLQPKPAPGAPPPSPVQQAPGMPGQAAPGVVQQGPPPTPAPNDPQNALAAPGAQGGQPMGDMQNPTPAPGQVPPPQQGNPMDATGVNPPPAGAQMMREPYGAQMMRRMHEDHTLLLQDYDEMLSLCELPELQQFCFDLLTGVDATLTAIENMFAQKYGHLPPLQGGMPAGQLGASPVGGGDPMAAQQPPPAPGAPGQMPDPSAMPQGDPNAPPEEGYEGDGEASDEEGPPTEGKEEEEGDGPPPKKKEGKALKVGERKEDKDVASAATDAMPANSGAKAAPMLKRPHRNPACPQCGKVDCSCKNRNRSGGGKALCVGCKCDPCGCGRKALAGGSKAACPKCGDSPCHCSSGGANVAPAGMGLGTKSSHEGESLLSAGLLKQELKWAKEAHDYLDELSGCMDFGEEHRMKSYSFHKLLGEIAGGGVTPASASFPSAGAKEGKAMQAAEEQMAADGVMMPSPEKSIHPHRLKCKGASNFYKMLSVERAFGDRHRDMARFHHTAMAELFEAVEEKLEEKIEEQTGESLEGGQDGEDGGPGEAAVGEPRSKEDDFDADAEKAWAEAVTAARTQQKAMDDLSALLKDLAAFAPAAA